MACPGKPLSVALIQQIKARWARGESIRKIAMDLRLARKTVKKYLS